MKIKTKLYVGFMSVLVLMIVLLAILMNMLNQLNQNMYKVVKEQYEVVRLTSVLRYEVNTISRDIYAIKATPPSEFRQKLFENVERSRLNANSALESLEKMATRERTQELVLKLKPMNEKYNELIKNFIDLVNAGQNPDITANKSEGALTRDQMVAVTDELMASEQKAMKDALNQSSFTYNLAVKMIYIYMILGLLLTIGVTFWVVRSITGRLNSVTSVISSIAYGVTDQLPRIEVASKDEIADIALAFNGMAQTLEEQSKHEKELRETAEEQSWVKTKIAEIATMFPGAEDLHTLADLFITKITPIVGASYGVFYIKEGQGEQQRLNKLAAYAYNGQEIGSEGFRFGEGLIGQCALENRMVYLNQVPENYIKITSGLGMAAPISIIILPVEFEGQVVAVIELASFDAFSPLEQNLLHQVLSNLGLTINSIISYMKVEKLLKESQVLTEELQSQSEELQLQQEELRTINEKLEEQYENSEQKGKELEKTQSILEEKARQVELSSKYKSEFLANMSHELRTPLNSLLILAQMLAENTEGNLTSKQVKYAQTIHSSGDDLLNLINEILDLSKVESGKMDIRPSEVILSDVQALLEAQFLPVAHRRGIKFITKLDAELPKTIYTDEQRLYQILKNLLSNAIKYTEQGSVSLHIRKVDKEDISKYPIANNVDLGLAISVADTGIGIPKEKQSVIFEAFQQVDGTTSRKYGGTGLGLTISREFTQLLGGFINVESVEGKGSTFTLYLPSYFSKLKAGDLSSEAEAAAGLCEEASSLAIVPKESILVSDETFDQSPVIQQGQALLTGRKILVVDDDMRNVFALTTALENHQMEVVFAENGREGIEVLQANPDIDLILMDIMMPEMDGYEAMRVIRQKPEYKTLPIIVLTAKAMKNDRELCINAGATDYISKPVNLEQLFSLMRVWLFR